MATKLPTGQTLNATLSAVNSIALNVLPAQHYSSHLLPARMLLKGLLLAFVDERAEQFSSDDHELPVPTLENFADAILSDYHNYMCARDSSPIELWVTGKSAPGPSPSPLRRIAVTHLQTILQDQSAARYGVMAVFDALGQYVTDLFPVAPGQVASSEAPAAGSEDLPLLPAAA
ncbi:hypothetical protein [Microvirga calopogonii]|uniref:hypothetical protein n=1 Tax=Microvirga calopogonii TaxID=2078013 RepID=UPI000E0D684A|nr:hypothetical protein [Microvirga calopogonii]